MPAQAPRLSLHCGLRCTFLHASVAPRMRRFIHPIMARVLGCFLQRCVVVAPHYGRARIRCVDPVRAPKLSLPYVCHDGGCLASGCCSGHWWHWQL